ncbi:MAG: cytochrome P450 [Actinobacteria bacterium]|nr:MAG: cytochrome P450 [Actinomycetota bacterium]
MSAVQRSDQVELATVNLMDVGWFAEGPPHDLFARMRAEAPVRWNPLAGGGFWSLTRHADISAVSRDTDTFSSCRGGIFLHPDQVVPLEMTRNLLLYKDPPEHTKYRLILQKAFTPHSVAKLEDAVRVRVTKTIDAVIEAGACDFAHDIAVPVPLGVLAELMGLPEADIARLYAWTEAIEEAQRAPEPAAATDVFAEMGIYLNEQIQVQTGGESLVMSLRRAEVDGEQLDETEILLFFGLLVFAGNDTTRNTAATGMLALLEHPDQLGALRARPELIPGAVEEILRFTSVVNYFARTATKDTEISDQSIPAGDKVILWYTSASRDEAVFDEPQRFDVSRTRPDHKAFGGGGRHFCLGAGLARLELRVLFEEVIRRLEGIERAGPIERLVSSWAHGLVSMPVRFAPARREG